MCKRLRHIILGFEGCPVEGVGVCLTAFLE